MTRLEQIEAQVDTLSPQEQKQLFDHLAQRLKHKQPKRHLPLVPASGRPITQEEIDDALDAD
jgi:hypothetical protein